MMAGRETSIVDANVGMEMAGDGDSRAKRCGPRIWPKNGGAANVGITCDKGKDKRGDESKDSG